MWSRWKMTMLGIHDDLNPARTSLILVLVLFRRHFYKQKRYPEALEKCEVALALLYDPQLQAMVDKIKHKIETGL